MEISTTILIIGALVACAAGALFVAGYYIAATVKDRDILLMKAQHSIAEQERDESQNRFTDLTNNLAAAVIVRDHSGKITYCSPFTEVLTGYPLTDIYESPEDFFLKICHETDKERLFRSLKITELGGEPFHFTFQFYHKSGIRMWAEMRTVPILDEHDEVVATLSITMDVTGSMLHQRQIEEKNRELKDFTYMVSHDLKAPIHTIKGMINIIEEDFKGEMSAGLEEIFSHISNASVRLEKLVTSVLDYSKIGSHELTIEPIRLSDVFIEVIQDHQHHIDTIGAHISIGDLPTVIGDKVCLTQIFSNLIGNALKYREPSRGLEIIVECTRRNLPHIVDIHVQDNGLGIPEDRIESIFRPFTRLHGDDIEGTGIGLASVRKLSDKIGAQVHASSVFGTGSTFTVSLREQ